LRTGEGQEPERPEIGLAEMAETDEPQPRIGRSVGLAGKELLQNGWREFAPTAPAMAKLVRRGGGVNIAPFLLERAVWSATEAVQVCVNRRADSQPVAV
jgi:hypothetical protein